MASVVAAFVIWGALHSPHAVDAAGATVELLANMIGYPAFFIVAGVGLVAIASTIAGEIEDQRAWMRRAALPAASFRTARSAPVSHVYR